MRFAIFLLHLSKVLRLPRKSDAKSYEVLHVSRSIISANLKIWGSKMQPLSGNQRPDLLTALMNMSLILRLPRKMHLCTSSSNVPRLPSFLEMPQNLHLCPLLTRSTIPCACHTKRHLNAQKWRGYVVFLTVWLRNVLCATTACIFSTSQLPKMVRTPGVCCTFWLRNVLRATTACTFSTSQLPKVVRTPGVFCTFWLRNVLRATTECTFSTSQFAKVVRTWSLLYILTSKCASRHNGVQFCISHLASWLRSRRFSERLAELLRFWRCQVQKNRESRRIASFSSLQIDR